MSVRPLAVACLDGPWVRPVCAPPCCGLPGWPIGVGRLKGPLLRPVWMAHRCETSKRPLAAACLDDQSVWDV
eukprot:351311-Chlamydomonas_euryale.AAC.4